MAIEKVYKCDLCGEFRDKQELTTVRVGDRDQRPEDYVLIDVGGECTGRPVSDLIELARRRNADDGVFR